MPLPFAELDPDDESASGVTVFTDDPESSLTAGLRRCVCVELGTSGSLLEDELESVSASGTCVRVTEVAPELLAPLLAMYTWR